MIWHGACSDLSHGDQDHRCRSGPGGVRPPRDAARDPDRSSHRGDSVVGARERSGFGACVAGSAHWRSGCCASASRAVQRALRELASRARKRTQAMRRAWLELPDLVRGRSPVGDHLANRGFSQRRLDRCGRPRWCDWPPERLLGSTAERVVRQAPCSVLVSCGRLREDYTGARIAVGVDFSAHGLEAVRWARDVAEGIDGEVALLCVVPHPITESMMPKEWPSVLEGLVSCRAFPSRSAHRERGVEGQYDGARAGRADRQDALQCDRRHPRRPPFRRLQGAKAATRDDARRRLAVLPSVLACACSDGSSARPRLALEGRFRAAAGSRPGARGV